MDPRRLERDIARGSVDAAFRVASMDEAVPPDLLAKAKRLLHGAYRQDVAEAAAVIWPHGTSNDFRAAADMAMRSRFVVEFPWLVMSDLGTIDDGDSASARTRSEAARHLEKIVPPARPRDRRQSAAFSIMLRDVMDAAADARLGSGWTGVALLLSDARRPPCTTLIYAYVDRIGRKSSLTHTFRGRISGGELKELQRAGRRFVPEQVGLPPLQGRGSGGPDPEYDHPWHEFERAYLSGNASDDARGIGDFVLEFSAEEWDGEAAMSRLAAWRRRSHRTRPSGCEGPSD